MTVRGKRGKYHHGDLKNTLVEAATELMAEGGVDALTLRAAARRAGVSSAAPYRHFPDKSALLAAVAEQGFVRMQQGMEQGIASAADPLLAYRNAGVAYVRYAVENPAHFRVMFGPELTDRTPHPALAMAAYRALATLQGCIARVAAAGLLAPGASVEEVSLASWAFVHGISSLVVSGQMPATAAGVEPLVDTLGRHLFLGTVKRP